MRVECINSVRVGRVDPAYKRYIIDHGVRLHRNPANGYRADDKRRGSRHCEDSEDGEVHD